MTSRPNPVFSAEYDRLREILIAARHAVGLTHTTLAARLDRSAAYISLFETGQRRLDILDFYELARALGGDPTALASQVFEGFREVRSGEPRTSGIPESFPTGVAG